LTHGGHDVQRGTHGPLGVIFVGDGRAPDRHHGVANELLNRAAVAFDDPLSTVEILGQQLSNTLGVTLFG
jgi:hypothetical protein